MLPRVNLSDCKDQVVANGEDRRSPFRSTFDHPSPDLSSFSVQLYAYTADSVDIPRFLFDRVGTSIFETAITSSLCVLKTFVAGFLKDKFSLVCTIEADISNMHGALTKHTGVRGPYWSLSFEIGLLFGTTELAAVIIWKDLNVRAPQIMLDCF